jgi:adenine-specific DNA-methyltransferase
MQDMVEALKTALESDASLFEGGELLKNAIIERALRMDPAFLEMLTASDTIREHFFIEVNGALIFDKVAFQRFVSNKAFLPDSYTAFKNRIGLMHGGDYLKQSRDVVLAWPYKDCVLEGGMTREDRGRQEVFWNESLAPDDVSRLFEPKLLTNFQRWDAEAVAAGAPKPVDEISEEDSLLIKGNNLLALHTLKARYAGKVKLIYIDPPYNTGDDGFRYNDRFNHATWLTFMRNRLTIARDLLSNDGSIFVNMDFNEVHYLKVLMDEIFGRENFQREIVWRIGWLSGFKTAAKNFIRNHDTILFYAKNASHLVFQKLYIDHDEFSRRYNDKEEKELVAALTQKGLPEDEAKAFMSLAQKHGMPDRYPIEDTWNCSTYDNLNSIAVVSFSGEKVSKMLGADELKGQKSEGLLKRIIESATQEGDIVMDFFFGTGTTGAVATKINRKWIGIEQMDYAGSTTKGRLKKVITGDGLGISKKVNWKGGGSFIYVELLNWNETFVSRIRDTSSIEDLTTVRGDMLANGYLRHDLNRDELAAADLSELSLEDAQDLLIGCLDMNHLFVNFGDMGDPAYGVSEDEQRLNRSFQEET